VGGQDDSSLNRKIIRKLLESEEELFSRAVIEEADDGSSAVTAVRRTMQRSGDRAFDFILMDFVMVPSLDDFSPLWSLCDYNLTCA
jgi:CheY-like chemotaxis protein